jgi:signal transduction histidine kinase
MLPVFAGGAYYLYNRFGKEINHETDEELLNDQLQWAKYLDTASLHSPVFSITTPEFNIHPSTSPAQSHPVFKSVEIYQEPENVYAPFRQLTQVIDIHGRNYELVLRKSLIEKDDLVNNIIHVMLIAFGGLLLFALLSNWFISKKIWKPFYRSLNKIQQLQLNKLAKVSFEHTGTYEFNQLNAALSNMTTRMYQDYLNMKELTEDTAHEMQTPLAIAQGKLELLLQDEALTDEQQSNIMLSYDELQRLSRLNHNLLLLAKIENRQYPVTNNLLLAPVIEKYLLLFEELINEKQLTVQAKLNAASEWPLHPALADLLISNLLGNAIKYNIVNGRIEIILTGKSLEISNTSASAAIPPDLLFQRFKKQQHSYSNSNGLGLAIVKKMADAYHLQVGYKYENGRHYFIVTNRFAPESTPFFVA